MTMQCTDYDPRPASLRLKQLCDEETAGVSEIPLAQFLPLVENRKPYLAALRTIATSVFSSAIGPESKLIVELSAGLGICRREFAPESLKNAWLPIEVNPSLIEGAKELYNDTSIRPGNAYDAFVANGTADSVVGLSSFDSISYLEVAFERIRDALRPGGSFCHIQDVVPSPIPGWMYVEHRLGTRPVVLGEAGCPWRPTRVVLRDENGQKEPIGRFADLQERMIEAIEKVGLRVDRAGTVAASAITEASGRHALGSRTYPYNVWDHGHSSSFESLFPDQPSCCSKEIRDLLITHGADPESVGIIRMRFGFPRLKLRGFGHHPEPDAPAPRSWLVDTSHPLEMLPRETLQRHNLLQEVAVADILVARKP